jgi:phospholipase C
MSKCTQWVDLGTIECRSWAEEVSLKCTEWAQETIKNCKRWADQGYNACDQWKDEGYSSCSDWADEGHNECCDWWPCSWACDALVWVSEWVCQAWFWVSNWVCKAWHWVAHWVCVVWTTIAKWVCLAAMWVVKAVCTVWGWVAKLVCILWQNLQCWFFGVVNGIARAFGRRPAKRRIDKVFVLMLENRSFDHMLGLAGLSGTDPRTGRAARADDLVGNPQSNVDPGDPSGDGAAHAPADFKLSSDDGDPGHEFDHTLEQLCSEHAADYDPAVGTYPAIDNGGFISSYRSRGSAHPRKVMDCYSPKQLPVLTALASQFAVCDRWFSSMPGPTWPNRFFAHAASSGGLDDSPSGFESATATLLDGYKFEHGHIFDLLEAHCQPWEIVEGDEFPQSFAMENMNVYALEGHFTDYEEFADEVSDPDYEPRYTFIEPDYGNILPGTSEDFTCGTSQHPLDDVTRGERLIKEVYEAIRNSPHWERSLLVVTYDEHGGFFDHVAPPSAVAPGDITSDVDNDHHGFGFTQLGVRVPAVIVSPLIAKGTIDHTVYDHASIPATLETLFGMKPMTKRDSAANGFLHLLTLSSARTDAPTSLPEPAVSGFTCQDALWGEDISRAKEAQGADMKEAASRRPTPTSLRGFAYVAFRRYYNTIPPQNREQRKRAVQEFLEVKTIEETREYIQRSRNALQAAHALRAPRRHQRIRGEEDRR